MKRYDKAEDVRMRLHGSICLYKGIPVWVNHHGDTLNVRITDVRTSQELAVVDSSDDDLDISSVPLGYGFDGRTAYYHQRGPYRQQRQGVSHDNTVFNKEYPGSDPNSWNRGFAIYGNHLADMIEGKFPSMDNIQTLIRNPKNISVPFHRKFAIVTNHKLGIPLLRYCSKSIGFYDITGKVALLLPPFTSPEHRAMLLKFGMQSEVLGNADEHA